MKRQKIYSTTSGMLFSIQPYSRLAQDEINAFSSQIVFLVSLSIVNIFKIFFKPENSSIRIGANRIPFSTNDISEVSENRVYLNRLLVFK